MAVCLMLCLFQIMGACKCLWACFFRQQRHLPDASPASLLGRIHELQEQRDAMNGRLFSLQRSNETLQQDNTALTAQNTTLQRQNAQLQQDCRQLQDEVSNVMPPSLGWQARLSTALNSHADNACSTIFAYHHEA